VDGSRCPPVNGLASLFNALSGNLGAHRRDRPLLYGAGLQPVEIRCDLVCDGFRAKSIEGDGSAESQASERKFSRNRAGIFMTNHVPARRGNSSQGRFAVRIGCLYTAALHIEVIRVRCMMD
jgi:hypothetical protein